MKSLELPKGCTKRAIRDAFGIALAVLLDNTSSGYHNLSPVAKAKYAKKLLLAFDVLCKSKQLHR